MHFNVITLFPLMFEAMQTEGVIGRALLKNLLTLSTHNPREFANNSYGRVDDSPFGGGAGMVMSFEPLHKTISSISQNTNFNTLKTDGKAKIIYLSPTGKTLNQKIINDLTKLETIILICGRYEGVDQRIIDEHVDEEMSIGDFVLSGGELAAACLIDAVARWLPNIIGNSESVQNDSFSLNNQGLLDHPHYTRPRFIKETEQCVPDVLLSGNHNKIKQWRRYKSLEITYEKRIDLMSLEHIKEFEKLKKVINKA